MWHNDSNVKVNRNTSEINFPCSIERCLMERYNVTSMEFNQIIAYYNMLFHNTIWFAEPMWRNEAILFSKM